MQAPLIIGGGPAGASAAILLGRAGLAPVLIERSAGPHDKVCGDFLSGEAIAAVTGLGVDVVELGAIPIDTVRFVRGNRCVSAPLPFAAVGLSRRVLDEALLRRAAASGARLIRGRRVTQVRKRRDGFVACARGEEWAAETLFLATGKHDLRDVPRPRDRRTVGIKTYVRLADSQAEALGHAVEIELLPGGYAGLQPVEGGRAAVCVLLFSRAGRADLDLGRLAEAAPHLKKRLAGAVAVQERPLTIAGMPYGYVAAPSGQSGLFRLGDQAAVMPSFAGAGVAMALFSGFAAAEHLLGGGDGNSFQGALARAIAPPIRKARMVHGALLRPWAQLGIIPVICAWPSAVRMAARATRAPFVS